MARIIDQRTGISIALAITLGSALFLAGDYMGKVDALERMRIPDRLALIQADLVTIKTRLGIPINPQVYLDPDRTLSLPATTAPPPPRPPGVPRRAAILPD